MRWRGKGCVSAVPNMPQALVGVDDSLIGCVIFLHIWKICGSNVLNNQVELELKY